ncbi:MAG TPA: formyltransferase family protein [Anaerolineales bacterium]|nr:formyltransferase family protein [Anaerolineales bacterium]
MPAAPGPPYRILFLGMNGPFSLLPLAALTARGFGPAAVLTPPPGSFGVAFRQVSVPEGPDQAGENLYRLAARCGIPVFEAGRLDDPRALALLEGLDYIVAACFPRLLPPGWLAAPRRGCLNLHPSLLPAYRGPYPIEDQLAAGETQTGITLHRMDAAADTGDILLQESYTVPPDATVDSLTRLAAYRGADLLVRYLSQPEKYPGRPQSGL